MEYNPNLPTFVQWNCRTIRLTEENANRLWSVPPAKGHSCWLELVRSLKLTDALNAIEHGSDLSSRNGADDRLGAP